MGNRKVKKTKITNTLTSTNKKNSEKEVTQENEKVGANIPILEELLFSLTRDLEANQRSDKKIKIEIYNNIRKVIDTMFYSEEYHLTSTFMWLND
jgi:ribonuclease I